MSIVSTHSRLKAAGRCIATLRGIWCCFNTQPPEGGWVQQVQNHIGGFPVSTHSRLKAAGAYPDEEADADEMFQHTAA